jgi:hypothetical protein
MHCEGGAVSLNPLHFVSSSEEEGGEEDEEEESPASDPAVTPAGASLAEEFLQLGLERGC